MSILVVEDNQSIREMVALVLEEAGYEVICARDGQEALDLLAQVEPHMILLDMRMPRMDGRTFAQVYRKKLGDGAPIVVMTASYNPAKAAEDTQAAAYLAKPFEVDDLLGLIRQVETGQ